MAPAPSATLQTGSPGAACVLVERGGTLVLDDGVERMKATRQLHGASVFVFGLFGQPRRGLFLRLITEEKVTGFPEMKPLLQTSILR